MKAPAIVALVLAAVMGSGVVWLATSGTDDTEEALYPGLGQRTGFRLRQLQVRIFSYQKAKGRLPASLLELDIGKNEHVLMDEWNRPIRYVIIGTGFEVRSAGMDGLFDSSDDVVVTSDERDEHDTSLHTD